MPFRDDFRGSAEKALESAAEIILSGDLNVILLEQTHCLLEKHLICKNKYVTSCVTNPYNCCVFYLFFFVMCIPCCQFLWIVRCDRPIGIF